MMKYTERIINLYKKSNKENFKGSNPIIDINSNKFSLRVTVSPSFASSFVF